jgi:RHS repeat-associated protein
MGNTTCYAYDALHRGTSMTYSGPYAAATPNKYFVYDSATVNGAAMVNAKGRLGEAYTAQSQGGTKLTDKGFSYTARGEVSDAYESTPHSGGYYHLTQNYWPHGLPNQLSGLAGLPTINFGGTPSAPGLDGEGRITQVTASSGRNPVTSTVYNPYGTPPQTTVTFGSGDSDVFTFDPNTGRMTQYQYNVGNPAQAVIGNLTWNPNGTLACLAITDPFNSANNQTCNYGSDDLTRVNQGICGSAGWGQNFTYDPFGNITKTVPQGNFGASFQPIYKNPQTGYTSNRYVSVPTGTVSYDADGNVLSDGTHQYAWDADGNSVGVDGVAQTFDALDRVVEQNRSGVFSQIVYAPTGDRLALMSGQSLQKAFARLPGAATAVYTAAGLDHYRHSDWLGSARFASTATPPTTMYADQAYAPFGEVYAQAGATNDLSFTGMDASTTSGDYDFPAREYDATAGRWPTPDPAGLAAADPADPQSWNRYAYVSNRPLNNLDPTGLGGPCGALNYDAGTAECGGGDDDPYIVYVYGSLVGPVYDEAAASLANLNNTLAMNAALLDPNYGMPAPNLGSPSVDLSGAAGLEAGAPSGPAPPPGYRNCVTGALEEVIAAGEGTNGPNGYGMLVYGTVTSAPAQFSSLVGTRGSKMHPIVLGPKSLSGFPGVVVQTPYGNSTAFGRYQILQSTWSWAAGGSDMSPSAQDDVAATILGRIGATAAAANGDFEAAIGRMSSWWASMPGSRYGQPTITMDQALGTFQSALGYLPECK